MGFVLSAVVFAGLVYFLGDFTANEANATNGAFSSTKHGGGTVDGISFSGVDRGVNPDYGAYYNNVNPEAGQYKAGECAHCHEPHASFGGSEPAPSSGSAEDPSGGPNQHLGMADGSPEFCWYCHENINFDPMFGGGTGYWKFYQGKSRYTQSSHYTNTAMKSPGFGAGSHAPRSDRTTNLQSGHCNHCHSPHGVKGSAVSVYDNSAGDVTYYAGLSANKQAGLTVPYMIPRQLIAFEEKLCVNCHDSDGPSTKNIKDEIRKYLPNSGAGPYAQGGSGHPIYDTDEKGTFNNTVLDNGGRHDLKNEAVPVAGSWNAEAANTRHVECVDCHNPHVAKSGNVSRKSGENATGRDVTVGPVQVGGVNKGVWGVSVNTSTGAINGKKTEAVYLYELCLKCHSSYADSTLGTAGAHQPPSIQNRLRWDKGAQGTGDASTHIYMPWAGAESDVAKDFKTTNDSYHPVFALGKNQPPSNANPRWGNALNCCGSCATPVACTQSGDGLTVTNATLTPSPPEEFGLGTTTYIKKRSTGKRNGVTGFANNFVPPWGPNAYVTCVDCHQNENEAGNKNYGPHGSSRPFILRKLDIGITYTLENEVINQTATGPMTVSYGSFSYGINKKGTTAGRNADDFIATVNLEAWDPNNLCLNCHRADVYGFYRQSSAWSGGITQAACGDPYPRFRFLSRQPHPADGGCSGGGGKGNSFDSQTEASGAGFPPRGIVCLRCHGGNAPGAIHGNDSFDGPGGKSRLLFGTVWTDYTPGTTTVPGSCVTGGNATLYNSCTHNAQGAFDTIAMYNY